MPKSERFTKFQNIKAAKGVSPPFYVRSSAIADSNKGFRSYGGLNLGVLFPIFSASLVAK